MSSHKTLSIAEVRLIKGMLAMQPPMNKQQILAHFTRPGRDLNHRIIAQIEGSDLWPDEKPASLIDTLSFVSAMAMISFPVAADYLSDTGATPPLASGKVFYLLLDWWPVGQGLFSSGAIVRSDAPPLTWVFDCGTSSAYSLLSTAIHSHREQQDLLISSQIDIAALSHFDKDHISGFVELLKNETIKIALLPYVPLWQRLIIAIEQGIDADSAIFEFFVNPANFLLDRDEGRELRVVFVQSTNRDDPVPVPDDGPDEGPRDDGRGELKIDTGGPPKEAEGDPVVQEGERGTRISFLNKAGRIVAPHFWEFVPYNDAGLSPLATPKFLSIVSPLIQSFRSNPKNRKAILAKLKTAYDANFGSSSKRRNLISLFLYSGSIGQRLKLNYTWASKQTSLALGTTKFCQMYTGDGYLDTPARLDAFERFYVSGDRLARSKVLQVMHHGAETNWQIDIAAKFQPSVSIFCSDPAHQGYKHPHAEVLRDFWPYYCVQVDSKFGFNILCYLSTM